MLIMIFVLLAFVSAIAALITVGYGLWARKGRVLILALVLVAFCVTSMACAWMVTQRQMQDHYDGSNTAIEEVVQPE